ncbi:UDP-N-acetylmuramoyl-L-alanine--D-glutamate ligase [Alkalihalobacillus oceani]|uniref:UDP-N-acetylmuramoylalanine--D-glutamate ligase n=1 Tax=Halalkalibacter oceani TaxID=1653776 RepID=A0A9X2DMW2_9BACI|nr:UDP-N-acetylmuramoyl-L-alanine--D-glutamate ligase [Halalkalibacter oceani]MCM3713102.1 UDP-N-acetylmuramoyl-L-alanine--D-glutamate ligase [Halalkalibacter oceani]
MKSAEQFQHKKILILGLAKSGEAAARLLLRLGAHIVVNDAKPYDENEQAQQLEKEGVPVVCGGHPLSLVDEGFDLIVKNPGIPYTNPIILAAQEKEIEVVTEIELAYLLSEAEIIAISGSNGKTTTTTLVYEMLHGGARTPLIAGNIGTVACEVAEQANADDVLVLEVSSFQLQGTTSFKPKVSVLLNLFDAHLDYHGTKEAYVQAKAKITANQTEEDLFVYNADDPLVAAVAATSAARLLPFSLKRELPEGVSCQDQVISYRGEPIIHTDEIVLPGAHNIENILAAIGAALSMGAVREQIVKVLTSFSGVAHRLEFVREVNGRRFYNDSKATNILASQKALEAFEQPIILLAGGLDRGNEFDELVPSLKNVRTLITFGETKHKLAKAAKAAGIETILFAEWVEDAVKKAYQQSAENDVILLSPACASWDQYKTFEERGSRFAEAVMALNG